MKPLHPVIRQIHLAVCQSIFKDQLIDPGLPDIGVLQFLTSGYILKPPQNDLRFSLLVGQDLHFHRKPAVFPFPVLDLYLTAGMIPPISQDMECLQKCLAKLRMHDLCIHPGLGKILDLFFCSICNLMVCICQCRAAGHVIFKYLFPAHIQGPPLHLVQVGHILVISCDQKPSILKLSGPAPAPYRDIPPFRVVPGVLDFTKLAGVGNPVHSLIHIGMVPPVDPFVPELKTGFRG